MTIAHGRCAQTERELRGELAALQARHERLRASMLAANPGDGASD